MKTIAIIVLLAGTALGQISADEAARRLEERRARRGNDDAVPVTAPATRPTKSALQFHTEAVAFLRAGQPAKAAPLLEQAYRATPPDKVSRALVLNRASVDIAQRANAMRAVKDICAYMQNHPGPDEDATNLLAAGLQTASKGNKLAMKSDLFQSSEQRLKLAIVELEQKRPREKKWGAQWMPSSEYSEISNRVREAETAWRTAQANAERLRVKMVAAQERWRSFNVIAIGRHIHNNRNHGDIAYCWECQRARSNQRNQDEARVAAVTAEEEYKGALSKAEIAFSAILRPEWPLVYRALDPDDEQKPVASGAIAPTTTPSDPAVPSEQTAASRQTPAAEQAEEPTDALPPAPEVNLPARATTRSVHDVGGNSKKGGLFAEPEH